MFLDLKKIGKKKIVRKSKFFFNHSIEKNKNRKLKYCERKKEKMNT